MNTITGHSLVTWDRFTDITEPSKEAWDWYTENKDGDVHIFEDTCIVDCLKHKDKIKIALLGEVPSVYDHAKQCAPNSEWIHPYEWLKTNHHHLDYVMSPFTYLKDIVGEKYIYAQVLGSMIRREQYGMYEKERLVSIIASWKNWLPGHKMRHEIIKKYRSLMDVYGRGYNTLIDNYNIMGKIIALAPYCFTIIIPNTNIDDWYSDQVPDAMLVGTIPVFCGTKSISKYFNMAGVIQFDSVEELGKILPTLTKELYQSKMNAVLDNFELAKHQESPADWLYYNKKEFLENIKRG